TYWYHRRILRAVQRRDAEVARAVMAKHIRVSRQGTLELWDKRQEQLGGDQPDTLTLPKEITEELKRMERDFKAKR
ncbi:MAG: hypothetical protein ABIH23_29315, partial [bacterium]